MPPGTYSGGHFFGYHKEKFLIPHLLFVSEKLHFPILDLCSWSSSTIPFGLSFISSHFKVRLLFS